MEANKRVQEGKQNASAFDLVVLPQIDLQQPMAALTELYS